MKLFFKINYNLAQKVRGENVFTALGQLQKSQWRSPEEIRSDQLRCIKNILAHAYANIPYYKDSFDNAGVRPIDIKKWEDFLHVPVVTKDILRNNPALLRASDRKYKTSQYSSSGSTGPSSIVFADRNAEAHRHAAVFRTRNWMGVDYADKIVMFWGIQLDRRSRLKDYVKDFFLNRKTFSTNALNADTFAACYDIIRRFKPKLVYGFTSAIYDFAHYIRSSSLPIHNLGIKALLVTGEPLFGHQREVIEDVFNCKAYIQYGAEEFGPLAYECPNGSLHAMAENVYIEVEKPDVDDGMGKLLFTGLNNYAMPLIRYKIGDVGVLSNKTCACGRGLPVISEISGRSVEYIRTPDGSVIHGISFDYLPKYFLHEIKQFQVVQNVINEIRVNIVKDRSFTDTTLAQFEMKLREVIGGNLKIDFKIVESIPREKTGKTRFIVTNLPQ